MIRGTILQDHARFPKIGSLFVAMATSICRSASLSGVSAPACANSTAILKSSQCPGGIMAWTGKPLVNRSPNDTLSIWSKGSYHALFHLRSSCLTVHFWCAIAFRASMPFLPSRARLWTEGPNPSLIQIGKLSSRSGEDLGEFLVGSHQIEDR